MWKYIQASVHETQNKHQCDSCIFHALLMFLYCVPNCAGTASENLYSARESILGFGNASWKSLSNGDASTSEHQEWNEGKKKKKRMKWGTFLVVQWLRLWTSTAGGVGSILGGVTKILHATGSRQKKKLKKWTARRLSGPALDVRFFHQYGSSQNHQGESCLPASTCRSWSTVLRKGSPGHKHNMPEPEASHSPYCVLGLQS